MAAHGHRLGDGAASDEADRLDERGVDKGLAALRRAKRAAQGVASSGLGLWTSGM